MFSAISFTALSALTIAGLALSQTPSSVADLSAPGLKVHATLPQHNLLGHQLNEALDTGRAVANSKKIEWKGLDFVVPDDPGNLAGFSLEAMTKLYASLTCQADAIVIGRVNGLASHVNASNTSVYSDYSVVIDQLLKDNLRSSIVQGAPIVVTRSGGTATLTAGKVMFDFQEFPRLEAERTYLHFLRQVPQSGAYHPIDSLSTLVLTPERKWTISRRAFSRIEMPNFNTVALEASIRNWLVNCK